MTYTTPAGRRAVVHLIDGSIVTLAPSSTLTLGQGFGLAAQQRRAVSLAGEAYFDVTPNHGAPFVVRTGRVVTRVLGTTFDVRHYPTDAHVRVAVVSGKVVATGGSASVTLTGGMVGRVTDSTAVSTTDRNVTEYVGWQHGQLVFRDTPVPDMLDAVGRWYGVEFRLMDSTLLSRHVTLTLDRKSQAEAVAVLEAALKVTTAFDSANAGQAVITLRPRRDGHTRIRRDIDESVSSLQEVGR